MTKLEQMKALVKKLHKASIAYYQYDEPIYTDKHYDEMYDELDKLEKETGTILSGSPTQKVQGFILDGLEKQKHSKPMLSAEKTKDINEIKSFVKGKEFYGSYKLDGCFSPETRIKMADGTDKCIRDINVGDLVMSFDENTKKVSYQKVKNVFNNGKKEFDKWIRLKIFRSDFHSNPYRLLCTKNHQIFTEDGWKSAEELNIGDKIYYYDYKITKKQEEVLLGIGLGDGWFVNRHKDKKTNCEPTLEWHYSKVNKNNYNIMIDHIREMFEKKNPSVSYRKSGYGSNMIDINLHSTRVPKYMMNTNNKLRCGFTYTEEIIKNITPLVLAILYIDDGSKNTSKEDGYESAINVKVRCQLAVNRHSYDNAKKFSDFLNSQGYYNTILFEKEVISKEGEGYRICFSAEGTENFFDAISKYIPKELRSIKLGMKAKWQNCEEIAWWKSCGNFGLCDGGIIVQKENGFRNKQQNKIRINRKSYLDSYDLEVENNHTYFANNYPVHNCTLVTIFEDGKLKTCLTRGSGSEGEIVTEQAKMISNIPKSIKYLDRLELRGECLVTWSAFNYINERLIEPFSHPRNMAAGGIRNLNTFVARDRFLQFVVFECVTDIGIDSKLEALNFISDLGFTVVPIAKGTIDEISDALQPEFVDYPVDGQIYEIDSRKLSMSMGSTAHHECCRMALKWEDETYETKLLDIEWNTTRTGLINPIAIFEPVEIQGSIVSKATLHNLSYIEELELGKSDIIEVYKSNMIIPKVHDNITRSNTWEYPKMCPCCNHPTEIWDDNGSKTLHCVNPDCPAQFISKLTHAVNKDCLNIVGLSESVLEALVSKGYVTNFVDLFHLDTHRAALEVIPGMGKKSVDKLLSAIEKARKTSLERFLCSLSVPLLGKTASKLISRYCHGDIGYFNACLNNDFNFAIIEGVGQKLNQNVYDWFNNEDNVLMYAALQDELEFPDDVEVKSKIETNENNNKIDLNGKAFCITGKLIHYANRDAFVLAVESHNGKVASGVTSKTDYLVTNDTTSGSSKNKKATELGIHIITEEEFIKMIGD